MSASATAAALCEEPMPVRRERRPCGAPGRRHARRSCSRARTRPCRRRAADCPVCGGPLAAHGLEARCDDCGSRLA